MRSLTKVTVIIIIFSHDHESVCQPIGALSSQTSVYITGYMVMQLGEFSFPSSPANGDFSTWDSSWQSPKVKKGPYVASHLRKGLQTDHPG